MARPERRGSYRPYRLEIEGELAPLDPLHIGTGERWSLATDAPILLDENGRPYIPGTTLRGVLRDRLEREAGLLGCGVDEIDTLFGFTPDREDAMGSSGRLSIFDSYTQEAMTAEVRDHVRLNSRWGAAAHGAKFDNEVALSGAGRFCLRIVYEGDGPSDDELILLKEAIRLLESGDLSIGAKSGWGYGRVKLENARYRSWQRTESAGLVGYLASRLGRAQPWAAVFPDVRPKPLREGTDAMSVLSLRIRMHFEGPVLVKAPIPPAGGELGDPRRPETYAAQGLWEADHVFITSAGGGYYLPGSSIRGVFRSQAIRIDHAMHADVMPTLFGHAKSNEQVGAKGLIEVSDGTLMGDPEPVFLDHVAIDRITAAAVDTKKFSQSALASPKFDISVRLRFTASEGDLRAVRLAAFVVRDLAEGRLWAGSGVSRGYGYIRSAELLEVDGDFVDSLSWSLPQVYGRRPGRTLVHSAGPFRFHDSALAWLWAAIENAGGAA